MQTITHRWTRSSDNPNEIQHSVTVENTRFWCNGQWVSGEGLRQQIGDNAAERMIKLHRQIREAAQEALRLHQWVMEMARRNEAANMRHNAAAVATFG